MISIFWLTESYISFISAISNKLQMLINIIITFFILILRVFYLIRFRFYLLIMTWLLKNTFVYVFLILFRFALLFFNLNALKLLICDIFFRGIIRLRIMLLRIKLNIRFRSCIILIEFWKIILIRLCSLYKPFNFSCWHIIISCFISINGLFIR